MGGRGARCVGGQGTGESEEKGIGAGTYGWYGWVWKAGMEWMEGRSALFRS